MLNLFKQGREIVIGVRAQMITVQVVEVGYGELVKVIQPTTAKDVDKLTEEIKEAIRGAERNQG